MRIVVFSDSHNNYFVLRDIVLREGGAEAFIHLGDGEKEFDYLATNFPYRIMRGVRGNCDWSSHLEVSGEITLCGKRIFYAHGHTYSVKSGLDAFKAAARGMGADIALYGHTHVAETFYEDGIHFMNPGSVVKPQQGPCSYGYIDITDAGVVTGIVEL